jgi:hypothetical protein
MGRRLLPLLLLFLGCGTAAGAPDGTPSEIPAAPPPAPSAPATSPPDAVPAGGCAPQPFVASPAGTTTQYQSLALDGATTLAFVEWITWDATTRTNGGEWLTTADTKTGRATRRAHFDGGPQAIVFDESAFYVGVWGSATSTGKGTGWLARVDRATSATTTLATGLTLSWSFAGLGDALVFSNLTDDMTRIELRTVAKAGGASTAIGSGLVERAKILAGDGDLAWVEATGDPDGTERLVLRTGNVATELARGKLVPTALARSGDTFYFADDTGVLSVPRAGGAASRVASAPRVLEIFADAAAVAWIQGPSYGGDLAIHDDAALVAVPAAGGAPAEVAHVRSPHDLVADASWLYWVDNQTTILRACRPF